MPKKKRGSSSKSKKEPQSISEPISIACTREDGKIHAVVFKLVAESEMVTKDAPSLWSLVDVMLIEQEEFIGVPNYLEDKFGSGLYHLYQGNFDRIHIQNLDKLKARAENDVKTIKSMEERQKLEEEKAAASSPHGFD